MTLEMRKLLHNVTALSELSAEISSDRDFEDVMKTALHTLLGTLAIPKGCIAEFTVRPRQLRVTFARGLREVKGTKLTLGRDEVDRFVTWGRPVDVTREGNGLAPFFGRNSAAMGRLQAKIAVPLRVRGELMGMVFLADKISRTDYDADDLEILDAICRHVGLAIHNHRLMTNLRRKAEENRRLYREMRQTYQDTVKAFAAAIDLKDSYTSGHSDRVARYAEAIAREMGVTGQQLEYTRVAGYLHDIGKIVVDRSIINNPRPLTDREFRELNRHVTTGYEILSNIRHPWKEIAYVTKCHHERFDGSGYPQGLAGAQIPLGARIVTLSDSFDAMMTDRPYRCRLPLERALLEVRAQTRRQFCPDVVIAFSRLLMREITGATRQRPLLRMIGLGFDRPAVLELVALMIDELREPRVERIGVA